jgi:hypothetical protein
MARDASGRYVDDDDYYGVGDRAAYGPSPERLEPKVTISARELNDLHAEVARLRKWLDWISSGWPENPRDAADRALRGETKED